MTSYSDVHVQVNVYLNLPNGQYGVLSANIEQWGWGVVGGEGDNWAQNVHKPQLFHRTSLNRE